MSRSVQTHEPVLPALPNGPGAQLPAGHTPDRLDRPPMPRRLPESQQRLAVAGQLQRLLLDGGALRQIHKKGRMIAQPSASVSAPGVRRTPEPG